MSKEDNSNRKVRFVKCNKFDGRRQWAVMDEDEVISYHREQIRAFREAEKYARNNEGVEFELKHDKTIEPSEKEKRRREKERDKKLNPLKYLENLDKDSEWKRDKEREENNRATIRYWKGKGEDYVIVKRNGHEYKFDGEYKGEWITNMKSELQFHKREKYAAESAIEFMKKHNYE